ncbi:DciA family protein [uncultured Porphyromonas sp.]|uniref:DciA family protein n=1 Tax=uncultured Porphyromonas sp. TaxID=159274 RepID=UPI00261C44BD|nr:DciA family protein [uncultured Porphyromonas sp.]
MQRKDPKPLGAIISDWLSESPEVDQGLLEFQALQYLRTRFYPLRRQIRELSIADHTLQMRITSASLRQEIRLTQQQLIEQINAHLQYDLIDEIIIR